MDYYKIVEKIGKEAGLSMSRLSLKIGRTSNFISGAKNKRSMPQVNTAAMTVGACGYTLCAIPKDDVPEGAFVIDPSE